MTSAVGPAAPDDGPHDHRRRWWLGTAAAAVVAVLVGVGVFLADSSHGMRAGSATTTTTAARTGGSTTAAASGTAGSPRTSVPATVTARLSQVVCPTTYGVQPTTTPELPSTVAESVPSELVGDVAVYTDSGGPDADPGPDRMGVLGRPRCRREQRAGGVPGGTGQPARRRHDP